MLAWLDLEMTGLDPSRHVIVEIATLVTDDELEIVAEGPDLVIAQPPDALAAMDEVVREMHTRSGLLTAIEQSTTTLPEAGDATLAFLQEHITEPGTVPLCGNSIGTDRGFIARDMPELDAHLHYRMVDVSSVKELCRRWFPRVFYAKPEKGMAHRALADIYESIRELDYYRRTLFVAPPGPSSEQAHAVAAALPPRP